MATATVAMGVWGVQQPAQADYLLGAEEIVVLNDYAECWEVQGASAERRALCGDILDSDGDGVEDKRDRCPETPAGVPVDERGCARDSDRDGVPDYRDKCPGTAPGTPVDSDGCPRARVERKVAKGAGLDLVSDGFAFDRSTLKPNMTGDLRAFAEQVKATPGNQSIDVIGHTDNIGSDAYNIGLSKRRAISVADYLARQGLDRRKMTITGRGESEPAADNRTPAGRARNRRVEVHAR